MVRKRGGCRPLSRVNRSVAENQSPPGDVQTLSPSGVAAPSVFWGVSWRYRYSIYKADIIHEIHAFVVVVNGALVIDTEAKWRGGWWQGEENVEVDVRGCPWSMVLPFLCTSTVFCAPDRRRTQRPRSIPTYIISSRSVAAARSALKYSGKHQMYSTCRYPAVNHIPGDILACCLLLRRTTH